MDAPAVGAPTVTAAPITERPRLIEDGDPRTRVEVLAVLDRLVANVRGLVPETDVGHHCAHPRQPPPLALPTTDGPLDLTDHETWLLRQICIDYVPGALEHFIALPPDLASEPVLDGRTARQVLDEQLALIEPTRRDGHPLVPARGRRAAQPRPVRRRQPSPGSVPGMAVAELATNDAEPMPVAALGADSRHRGIGGHGRETAARSASRRDRQPLGAKKSPQATRRWPRDLPAMTTITGNARKMHPDRAELPPRDQGLTRRRRLDLHPYETKPGHGGARAR